MFILSIERQNYIPGSKNLPFNYGNRHLYTEQVNGEYDIDIEISAQISHLGLKLENANPYRSLIL